MKQTLLFFMLIVFFISAYFGRYQPVSLDLVSPTTKQVEIKGSVKKPGIYTVKWDGTIKDVIEKAGGLTESADTSAISMVKEVENKDVIVIPEKGAETIQKVSINSASVEELDTLPGVGPAIAERIVAYRSTKSFSSIEEIMEVKGIGEKMFAKIKDQITL